MRISARLLLGPILVIVTASYCPAAQKQISWSPRILFAKTVYFDNQTGSIEVGNNALAQLKKWGRFQIVSDRKHADLIFLLSADSPNGANVILADGQTGTIHSSGHIEKDPIPNYNKESQTRYAYLTVVEASSGETLWSEEHAWGGLLTGFNSAGRRLIADLEKQIKEIRP